MSIVIAFFRQCIIGYRKQAVCQAISNELFKLLFKREQAETDGLEHNELVDADVVVRNQVTESFYLDPRNVSS